MVQIIQETPRQSFSSLLGQKLGEGLGSGLSRGAEMAFRMKEEKANKISKEKSSIRRATESGLRLYDPTKALRDPKMISQIEDSMGKLVDQGHSANDAFKIAYEDLVNSLSSGETEKSTSSFQETPQWAKDLGIVSENGPLSDVGIGVAKGTRPIAQFGDIGRHTGQQFNYLVGKLMGLSDEEIQQKQKNVEAITGPSLTERFDKLTGGAGKPESSFERVIAGYPMGGAGLAGSLAGETLDVFGAPESVKNAGEFITFLTAHRLAPKKPPGFKLGNHAFEQAERIASETGKTAEEVISAVQSKAGIDLGKVLSGDVREAEKFSEALTQSSKRVSEAPKQIFNPKAAEKERSIFGKRVAESPLEEYYDIEARAAEKASKKTAPTLAKEEEITKRLSPVEKQLSSRANEIKDQMTRMQQAKRGVPESGRARIDLLISEKEKQLSKVMGELEETRYELRNFRSKPTESQTAKQIEESIDRFRKEAKEPTTEGQARIAKDLEGDRKYLEVAAKLDKRGQLPGDLKPDTYVQMQLKYLDAYKEAIKSEREAVKGVRGAERGSADQFVKYLSDRVKALEAKIVKQTDKQKALRALEKPSGAFYKQQLKETRKDLERFKKDFFKHTGRIKSIESAKASSVAKEAFKEAPAVAKKEAVAKQGLVQKELGRFEEKSAKVAEKELSTIAKEIPKSEGPISVKKEIDIAKKAKRLVQGMGAGAAIGAIQAIYEEYTGDKIPSSLLTSLGAVISLPAAAGGTFTRGPVYKAIRDIFEDAEVKRMHALRAKPSDRYKYYKGLLDKRGKAQTDRIMKKLKDIES